MKKFTYLAAMLLVMAGAVSCKKNAEVKDPKQQEPQGKMIPFSVTAGSSKEKTSMVDKVLSWTEGDVINVMTQDGQYPTSLTLSGGAGTATGSFEGEISENVEDGAILCGMYNVNYSNGAYTVNIPATQTYTEGSFQEGLYPSIGTGTYVKDGKTSINFSTNPLGILRVTVKGASDEILTKVSIKSNNADIKLAGDFTLESGTWAVSGGTEDEIVMNCPNLQLSAAGVQVNFVVPPVTFASGDLKVVSTITKAGVAGKLYTETNSSEITINANDVAKIERSVVLVKDVQGYWYNVCKIGSQIWTAENMRCNQYDTNSEAYNADWLTNNTIPTSLSDVNIPYYTDPTTESRPPYMDDDQWGRLGMLYNWAAAVGVADGEKQTEAFSNNRQGICPNGWHVPSRDEWTALVNRVEQTDGKGADTAGKHLRTTSGWNDGSNPQTYPQGLDSYGFAALPAGFAGGISLFSVGTSTYFWTATPSKSKIGNAYGHRLIYSGDELSEGDGGMNYGQSVRCLKN
ncbi:MAG: hypothetical protein MJ010_07185 [Paludibacteraceae bacterium]|nr:hypothetical protein [Paludibacteraceae bacterium]